MQQMVAIATSIFPSASIHVPLIHYSDRLTAKQQLLIEELNSRIQTRFKTLTRIDKHFTQITPIQCIGLMKPRNVFYNIGWPN